MWLVATLLNRSALDCGFLSGLLSLSFFVSKIVPGTYNKQVSLIMFIELISE